MSLIKSTAIVSAMTTLSRLLGLVRDMVFARFVGAEGVTDAFFIAFFGVWADKHGFYA